MAQRKTRELCSSLLPAMSVRYGTLLRASVIRSAREPRNPVAKSLIECTMTNHTVLVMMMAAAILLAGRVAHGQQSAALEAAPLEVTSNVTSGAWIRSSDHIELRLSRVLDPAQERVAILIGNADWTDLFGSAGGVLRYRAGPVRLPAGESSLTVYLVSPANGWRQVAQWTVRVRTAAGFEQAEIAPKFEATNQGQVAENHAPASNAPAREEFQDMTVNVGLRTTHRRAGTTATTQINLLGVSNRPEALRFGQRGAAAPKLDLADYLVGVERRRAMFQAGHLTFSPQRHLVTDFASRGIAGTLRLPRTELTVAALHGSSIVGFDNFFGLATRRHQVTLGTIATDVLSRPGGVRLELTLVDGSRLPQSGFTQGQINDTEKGRGAALRIVASDKVQRLRLDAGSARSQFGNPPDPLLSGGLALVPLRDRTNDAHYVDASYDFVRAARIKSAVTNVTGTYRFERVAPLYRSVGAQAVLSDLLLNTVEVSGGMGPLIGQISESWSHDNLGRVRSILTTNTRIRAANLALPLASLVRPTSTAAWLPVLTYSLQRTALAGEGRPENGGFVSPAQIPDQANTNHTLQADWTHPRWRAGYAANYSFVDNRQEGRASADFETIVQQVTFALGLTAKADLAIDVGIERAVNREVGQVGRTRRAGLNGTWRITQSSTVTAILSRVSRHDAPASRNDATDANVQYAQAIPLRFGGGWKPRAQLFGRWSWQSAETLLFLLGGHEDRRNWSVNTGVSLSLF